MVVMKSLPVMIHDLNALFIPVGVRCVKIVGFAATVGGCYATTMILCAKSAQIVGYCPAPYVGRVASI